MTFDDAEILRLCGNRPEGLSLIKGAWALCEVWDDAVDGDKRKSETEIADAFCWALFGLWSNPLWRESRELHSALRVAIADWRAANELEKSGDFEKVVTAYTLRCSPFSFFVAVVLAANGPAAADEAARYFRGMPSPDRLASYMHEHTGMITITPED